jgi:hypothetical protein
MRWRCTGRPFHRSAFFNCRTLPLVHLTIWFPPNQMAKESHLALEGKTSGKCPPSITTEISIQLAMEAV